LHVELIVRPSQWRFGLPILNSLKGAEFMHADL
jgi:hypothetical protein